jgi:hypothetical protein
MTGSGTAKMVATLFVTREAGARIERFISSCACAIATLVAASPLRVISSLCWAD